MWKQGQVPVPAPGETKPPSITLFRLLSWEGPLIKTVGKGKKDPGSKNRLLVYRTGTPRAHGSGRRTSRSLKKVSEEHKRCGGRGGGENNNGIFIFLVVHDSGKVRLYHRESAPYKIRVGTVTIWVSGINKPLLSFSTFNTSSLLNDHLSSWSFLITPSKVF